MLCEITPVGKPGEPVDPGFGQPAPPDKPVVIPPLPGIWPPKGQVAPPIHLPPAFVMPPIYIDGTPENPINLPPGLWPPLPPEIAGKDKVAVLVAVVGLSSSDVWKGYRWAIIDTSLKPTPK